VAPVSSGLQPARSNQPAVLVDAHVHIHPRTDVTALLSSAERNFGAIASLQGLSEWHGVLLLTEMAADAWFDGIAAQKAPGTFGPWQLSHVEPNRIEAKKSAAAGSVSFVAGRQVVTTERIEVLALGTRAKFEDGRSLEDTIQAAQNAEALVVLPWGVGKWLGQRGRLVEAALKADRKKKIFAGDIASRPSFWPEPPVFRTLLSRGLPVLPGSDPLPLKGEEEHVGACGFWFNGRLPSTVSGAALQNQILQMGPQGVHRYGKHDTAWRLVWNQVAYRLRSRKH
jgi:hypothetical protein